MKTSTGAYCHLRIHEQSGGQEREGLNLKPKAWKLVSVQNVVSLGTIRTRIATHVRILMLITLVMSSRSRICLVVTTPIDYVCWTWVWVAGEVFLCTCQCHIAQYWRFEVHLSDFDPRWLWGMFTALNVIVAMTFTCTVTALKADGCVCVCVCMCIYMWHVMLLILFDNAMVEFAECLREDMFPL